MADPVRIFVSHSHQDNEWCRAFVAELRGCGADVWYDEHNLGFGVLQDEIERELRARGVFIVILSPRAVSSHWVQRELAAAIHLHDLQPDRVVLPVVAEKCDIPLLWISYKRVSGPDDMGLMPKEAAGRVAHMLGFAAAQPTTVAQAALTTTPRTALPGLPSLLSSSATGQRSAKRRLARPPAITDLYDEERHAPLVRYPGWLIAILGISGFIAIAVTGFLGYGRESGFPSVFAQPWVLFLWLCALLITLQASVLREKSLRSRLVATLVVSALAILLLSIYSAFPLLFMLSTNMNTPALVLTYILTLINFVLLATFWIGAIWRISRGEGPTGGVRHSRVGPIAMNILGGASVAFVLALVFRAGVVGTVAPSLGSNTPITTCTVSWPFGTCDVGGTPHDPPTLFFIDLLQALLLFVIGFLLLVVESVTTGLGGTSASTRQNTQRTRQADNISGWLTNISTWLLPYRYLGWIVLIFVAVYSLARLSSNIESYLHTSPQDLQAVTLFVLPALVFGLVATLAATAAPAVMLMRWRPLFNSLRFIGLIGFVILSRVWIMLLALMCLDLLLSALEATSLDHHPFYPPSFAMAVSLLAFLYVAKRRQKAY